MKTLTFASISKKELSSGGSRHNIHLFPKLLTQDYIVGITYDGNIHALAGENGAELWRYSLNEGEWDTAWNIGILFASDSQATHFLAWTHDSILYSFDLASGNVSWNTSLGGNAIERFAQDAESVYVITQHDDGCTIYSLDITTGEQNWQYTTGYGGDSDAPGLVLHDAQVLLSVGVTCSIGNVLPTTLIRDEELRAAPSSQGVSRGSTQKGAVVDSVGDQETAGDERWVEITVGETSGWVPFDSIDPTTLPPEGGWEYVYIPD